jgi:methionine synthase II (cobalamin-independent)
MFITFAGGYSRLPLPAQPDLLGQAEADLAAGRIDPAAYEAVADTVVEEVVAEMATVGASIAGDGGVRRRDRILPWIDGLTGLASGEPTTLPDGEPATRPLVTGPVTWHGPLLVRDWTFANDHSDVYIKQPIVGPYTIAGLAEPTSATRRRTLALQLAEAMNAEIRALRDATCALVEIDEPAILHVGDDAHELETFRLAQRRLVQDLEDPTEIHLSLALWGNAFDPALDAICTDLPFSSYLVDVLAGPTAWRFIARIPPERGVITAAGDAHTEDLDLHEVLVWSMAWAAEGGRGPERVGLAPNGSLCFVSRHYAHRKLGRLGEALNLAKMGPLADVAVALDEHPLESRLRGVRRMAEAVHAGRAS